MNEGQQFKRKRENMYDAHPEEWQTDPTWDSNRPARWPWNPKRSRDTSGWSVKYSLPRTKKQLGYGSASDPHMHDLEISNQEGKHLGNLSWDARSGRVSNLGTDQAYESLGVATHLWEHANKIAESMGIKAPKHSNDRTPQGDAWATSVGGAKPKNNRRELNADGYYD